MAGLSPRIRTFTLGILGAALGVSAVVATLRPLTRFFLVLVVLQPAVQHVADR